VVGHYLLPAFGLLDLIDRALDMPTRTFLLGAQGAGPDFAVKILLLADLRWFGGATALHSAVALLAAIVAFIGIAAAIDRTAHPAREITAAATGLLALVWFRAVSLEPYVITPGADHVVLVAGAVGCIGLAASIGPREPYALRTLFAALFGLGAAATLPPGLLVLPLAALVLWRRCDADWPAMLLAVLALLAIATFFIMAPPGGSFTRNPITLLRFMAWMFGNPWVKVTPLAGEVAGWWTIALCLAVAVFGLFSRHVDGAGAFSGALAALALLAALLIGINRASGGLEAATAGRFALVTALAHASLIVAGVRQVRLRRTGIAGITTVILIAIGAVLLAEQVVVGQRYAARAALVAGLRAELEEGRFEPEHLNLIYADGARAAEILHRIADAGLYGLRAE
jgi:cell division protein FtsL